MGSEIQTNNITIMAESITSSFFEVSIRFNKELPSGETKRTTERYVIEANTFSEAEERIAEFANSECIYEYEVRSEAKASYNKVIAITDNGLYKWFKARVRFTCLSEGKEKQYTSMVLVQGSSIYAAAKSVEATFGDYDIIAILETKNIDVIFHEQQR